MTCVIIIKNNNFNNSGKKTCGINGNDKNVKTGNIYLFIP